MVAVPGGYSLAWRGFPDESHLLGARIARLIATDYDGAKDQLLAQLLGGQRDAHDNILKLVQPLERNIYRTLSGSIIPFGGERGKEDRRLPRINVDAVLEGGGLDIDAGGGRSLKFVLDLIGAPHPRGGQPEEVSAGIGVVHVAHSHLSLHLGGHPLPVVDRGSCGRSWSR